MTKTELLEIIAGGENSGVEFKRDDVRPEQLAKECVALLNLKGGYVLLGVEDNGDITGLTRNNSEEWIMDTVFGRHIHPAVIPYYEEINMEHARVGVIELSAGVSKPYSVRANDREDIYIRVGKTSRLATREQILRLMQEGSIMRVESLPVNGTSMDDVDLERFTWYYENFYGEKVAENTVPRLLTTLDLGKAKEDGSIVLTIAGNILFAKEPARKLPQAGFRITAYPGREVDINASFDEIITTPIVAVKRNKQVIKTGLVDYIFNKLQILISEEKLDESGHRRERYWQYPKEVLRELVVNAIAHRDWTKFSKNKIEIFEDRIEITSVGAIPNNQTLEKMLAGVQYSRNQILVRILREVGEMDERGMGLRRRVLPILNEQGFPEPRMETTEDFLKVTIWQK